MKCPAKELYCSPLFLKARMYCEAAYNHWYILSAKYGLLEPRDRIEPYDMTLKDMGRSLRKEWANKVLKQLQELDLPTPVFFLHAGKLYIEFIEDKLVCNKPVAGLGIGEQLAWYCNKGF